MRYLVKARVKLGMGPSLLQAIVDGSLGRGSIAGDEYTHDLQQARLASDGSAQWVEVCYCSIPLEEERPYWEILRAGVCERRSQPTQLPARKWHGALGLQRL
jgi:hypothetical protein